VAAIPSSLVDFVILATQKIRKLTKKGHQKIIFLKLLPREKISIAAEKSGDYGG